MAKNKINELRAQRAKTWDSAKAFLDSHRNEKGMALMFCVAYTYEHREDCDYKSLNLTLRALLYADREARF